MHRVLAALITLALGLAACAKEPERRSEAERAPAPVQRLLPLPTSEAPSATAASVGQIRPAAPKIAEIYPAQGARVGGDGTGFARRPAGDITLDFTGTEIREVVQVVLRDLLGVGYIIDPEVSGAVTVRSGQPLRREDLIAVLESVLEASDAALVRTASGYRVTTAAKAQRAGPGIGIARRGGQGFGVSVHPLSFIGAEEMRAILEPLVPAGRILRADAARGLIVAAGNAREQRLIGESIRIFDVDQMAGTSVLIESLEHVDPTTLAFELDNVFGGLEKGPLAGIVRLLPIERMNAIMVLSQQMTYLEEARNWIARLDRQRQAQGRRLFVYYVQNGKAANLTATLQGIFQPGTGGASGAGGLLGARAESTDTAAATPAAARPAATPAAATPAPAAGRALGIGGDIRIMADETNNAVLVLATPQEYAIVEEVLIKLDLQPLQVLIQANIVEVTLNDSLRFGVQYFIKSGGLGITEAGSTIFSTGATGVLTSSFPGFAFTLADETRARLLLEALSQLTEVNMISTPQVMVLDNQPARLQVGDQVPIITQQSTSTFTADPRTVNSVEYRDTGVTLVVTPRVNASGLVTIEISQEVSNVTQTTTSTIDSPTIQQRKIVSTVAVKSNETVVLGGLIRESATDTQSGIPVLSELPIVGPLFSSTRAEQTRTELLVLIQPTVIRNAEDARNVTASLRRQFHSLLELEQYGVRQPRRFERDRNEG